MYRMDCYSLGAQHPNQLDQLPSTDDWYQWNQGSNGMSMSPLVDNTRENSEISLHGNQVFGDWPEYQFDEQSERDWENDMFMNSLLKDDQPDTKIQFRPIGMYYENQCSTVPFDDFSTDMVTDSQKNSGDQCDFGNSKYMKYDSPQSMDWNKLDDTSSHFMSSRKDETKVAETKAPVLKIFQDDINTCPKGDEHVDEETSFRAAALQDLEVVMTQLNLKTRIFFRDSLYRLAKNSRRQSLPRQNSSGEFTLNESTLSTDHQETSPFGKGKLMELETNIIDRTVANLMFNDLNCNVADVSFAGSMEFSDESVTATSSSFNSNFNQSAFLPSNYSE